jgi:hypothetical protein
MEYRDYYKLLGVERAASAEQIKTAYRRLARKFHPDVSKEKNAEERFKEVQEAYEVLKDAEKRAAYDQLGSEWKSGQPFRPPPDWGSGFEFSGGPDVGGRRRRAPRGGAGDGEYAQEDFSDFFSSLFVGVSLTLNLVLLVNLAGAITTRGWTWARGGLRGDPPLELRRPGPAEGSVSCAPTRCGSPFRRRHRGTAHQARRSGRPGRRWRRAGRPVPEVHILPHRCSSSTAAT